MKNCVFPWNAIRLLMDQTTDVIFEWDIREDTLVFSSNWEKRFDMSPYARR